MQMRPLQWLQHKKPLMSSNLSEKQPLKIKPVRSSRRRRQKAEEVAEDADDASALVATAAGEEPVDDPDQNGKSRRRRHKKGRRRHKKGKGSAEVDEASLRFQMHKCLSRMPRLWKFRMNPASPAEGGARKAKRAWQRRMRPLGQKRLRIRVQQASRLMNKMSKTSHAEGGRRRAKRALGMQMRPLQWLQHKKPLMSSNLSEKQLLKMKPVM